MAALLTVLLLVFTCGGPRYTNIAGVSCIVCVSCKYGVHAYMLITRAVGALNLEIYRRPFQKLKDYLNPKRPPNPPVHQSPKTSEHPTRLEKLAI